MAPLDDFQAQIRRTLGRIVMAISLATMLCVGMVGTASSQLTGKADYLADCASCHGEEGAGSTHMKYRAAGYVYVDLRDLSKAHGGQFPRQEVYDIIDGSKRTPSHWIGGMPKWGLKYQLAAPPPDREEKVRQKISALVDYIESIQEK